MIWCDAENCIRNGISLEAEQELTRKDSIIIKDGFLILAHNSGSFFEFSSDTVLYVTDLASGAEKYQEGIKPLKMLYQKEFYSKERSYSDLSGAVHNPYPVVWILPFTPTADIQSDVICLKWKKRNELDIEDHTEYLKVFDMFDEELDALKVNSNSIKVDLSKYSDNKMILLQIMELIDDADWEFRSERIAVRFTEDGWPYFPELCNEKGRDISALEIAFFYESNYMFEEADQYYQRSTELSDHPAYEMLYNNFKKRHNK